MSEATDQLNDQLVAEKELVELRGVAQRLAANPDFRRLVFDEYFMKETARLAMLAGDPIMGVQERADAAQMSMAAGHFKRFLSVTVQRGNAAESNIKGINEELEEIRIEGAND